MIASLISATPPLFSKNLDSSYGKVMYCGSSLVHYHQSIAYDTDDTLVALNSFPDCQSCAW